MNAFSFVNKCVSNGYNKIMAAGEPVADVRAAMHSQGFDFLTVGVPKEPLTSGRNRALQSPGKKWNGTDLTW